MELTPTTPNTESDYRAYVRERLSQLSPIFAKASIGDFSSEVAIPEEDDEFTELFVGIQVMLEVIREQLGEMKDLNATLGEKVADMRTINHELERERAKAEAILASIGESVVVTDEKGVLLFINDVALEQLGFSRQELIGQRWNQPMGELQSEKGQKIPLEKTPVYRALEEQRRIMSDSMWIVRKDGTRLPIQKTATPVILNGKTVGSIAVFRDITREREIDRAKSEFVSLASHQLRTPLSIIGWYVETLLNERVGKLHGDQKKYLHEISASNRRLVDLVNALLNVSRLEMGTLMVEPEATDIVLMLESVLHELQIIVEKKSLMVHRQFPDPTPSIAIDPKLIRIVFQNLLSNAIRYTPNGGTITLNILEQLGNLVVSIKDTGYGIPRRQWPKIFTKLFRADNIRDKEPDGNGLGLYLAKAIVEESGGSIAFTSQEGVGSTFVVSLPLKAPVRKRGQRELIPPRIK